LNYKVVTEPNELLRLGWKELVAGHPHGTVFQSPEMYGLFDRTEKMFPVAVGVLDEERGKLCGVMLGAIIREMKGLAGYFSSRTVVYGGPLVDAEEKEQGQGLDLLLQQLIEEVKNRSVFIQFRNFRDMEEEKPVFEKNRFHFRDRLNYLVDTSSDELVKKRVGTEKLRQLKKGQKNGARILPPESEEEMREFYLILQELYRNKVKKPLPDWTFFLEFYRLAKNGDIGTVQLVKLDGKVIGGILSPVTPGKTIYEWYVCGLDQEHREAYPSVLATWAAIDHALAHGIQTFDFMGVGIPGRSYGVRTFKARFGGKMVNYGRFARVNNRLIYFLSEMGYNLLAAVKRI
jgi:hypothetical protein